MKYYIIAIAYLLGVTCADSAEKDVGRPTAWEVLIATPEKRKNIRIHLDGYLKLDLRGDELVSIRLYMDKESLRRNRNFRFLDIETEPFLKSLPDEYKNKLATLNHRYVTMKGLFEEVKWDDERNGGMRKMCIGVIHGPYFIAVYDDINVNS